MVRAWIASNVSVVLGCYPGLDVTRYRRIIRCMESNTPQPTFVIEVLPNGRYAVINTKTGGIVDAYDRRRHAEIRLSLVISREPTA